MTTPNPLVPAWHPTERSGFFNSRELRLVEALFARILPGDHARQIPSATEAGAVAFLDRLLSHPAVYEEIAAWQALYRSALPALNEHARAAHGRELDALEGAQLDALIAGLEAASITGLPAGLNQTQLFATLRRHCLQGCLADPRWGGNRDRIMWRALGYLQPAEDLYRG
jgi:gluconate 2-dehydrogenase gamma chain